MNIQVHGGIGFTWEHDAHLYLRRALVLNALLGSPADAEDVTAQAAKGTTRGVSLDLPPEADAIRTEVRVEAAARWPRAEEGAAAAPGARSSPALMVPPGPRRGAARAGAIEQIVIDQELAAAGVKVPGLGITGCGTSPSGQPVRHPGPDRPLGLSKTLMGEYVWCQLSSSSQPPAPTPPRVKTKNFPRRREAGWSTGQKVWTSGAQYCHLGLATVRTNADAAKHAGITTMVIDMHAEGVEVRPLRQITGNSDFNEVFFNDVFVPDDDVVGTPDDGWTVARTTLGNERVSIGGGSGGIFPTMDLLDLLKFARTTGCPTRRGPGRRHFGQGAHAQGAEPAPGSSGPCSARAPGPEERNA